jgi:hypothetical protein
MDDRQLEDRLRWALRAEVEGLPLTITPAVVLRRSAQRQRMPRLAWAIVAAAAGLVLAAGIYVLAARPPTSVTGGSPTPLETPSTAPGTGSPATPGSAGNESTGTMRVAFEVPQVPEAAVAATCRWADTEPVRVAVVTGDGAGVLQVLGESLGVSVSFAGYPEAPFVPFVLIDRKPSDGAQRAAYATEPTDTLNVGAPGDQRSGLVSFAGIDTLADDTPVDLLPLPRAEFGQPLGGDPKAQRISGTVSWECDPPPPGFDPPPASPSPSPVDPGRFPSMELRASTETSTGVALCGGTVTEESGTIGDPTCPSRWVSPNDYPAALPAQPGEELRLGPSVGWGLRGWLIVASTNEEIERTLGRPVAEIVLREKSGEGTVSDLPAAFQAPTTPGTWIMRATVSLKGEGVREATGTFLFVLDVGGAS